MPATISANRLRAGGPAVTVLFIANSNMRTLIEPPSGKKISTKVRPVAHATQWTRALRFLRMKKPTWESCGEHGVTADLSDSNHEDFCRIPARQRSQYVLPQLALTLFSRIFSICGGVEVGRRRDGEAQAQLALTFVKRPLRSK